MLYRTGHVTERTTLSHMGLLAAPSFERRKSRLSALCRTRDQRSALTHSRRLGGYFGAGFRPPETGRERARVEDARLSRGERQLELEILSNLNVGYCFHMILR
jgi:hypothetical protein